MRTRQVTVPRRNSRMGIDGDGSTLNLDFTMMGGALDSRFTFSRAGNATYINSSGYVATATTNAPRFDYDPTTLAAKGLLIEGSATNYFYNSQSLATSGASVNWIDSAILSRTSGNTDPANGATAIGFNETLALDYHRINSYGTLTGVVTISVFVKQINAARRFAINAGVYAGVSAIFDLTTGLQVGATGGTASNKAASATAYPNGWFRFSVTGTYAANSNIYLAICSSTSTDTTGANFTGTSDGGVYIWGAQLESGTGASSYIPTVTSQVNRTQELCTLPITPANIGLTTSPIGTCFYEATVNYLPTSGYPLIVGFADIGNSSKAWLSQTSTTGSNYSSWKTSTGTVGDITFSNIIVPRTSFKFASSISSTQNLASRNGTAGTAGAVSSAVLSVPTQLNFGGVINSMIITKFKFFPTTKSQAELNALSA
jgi:hypothetical protein